jgi:hypothetical protein
VFADPFVTASGRVWPTSLTLRRDGDPPEKALSLRFSGLEFDVPLDAKKFEMRIPPDTTRVATFQELGRE